MDGLNIARVPAKYRPALISADTAGNANGIIDSDAETAVAVGLYCQAAERPAACDDFREYIKSELYCANFYHAPRIS